MIERYTRPEMGDIWSNRNKYATWLRVEVTACEAMASLGLIPKEAVETIVERADFDVERIDEIEKTTKHDVIAFLTAVAEKVGPESRYIHMGMTSSDVLDTGFAIQLAQASEIIIKGIEGILVVIRKRAFEHKDTPMMGRSHGVHAEPITFGLKMALWYAEMERNLERMRRAAKSVAAGKISGAVGTFANIPIEVEAYVCEKCGLDPAPISTQVVQRDRHAEFFSTLAIIAATIEKFAVEIRHLQRTEVLEVEEPFTKGQKGSSAMPHKRNPILSENITGLARIIRANAGAAFENVALWHERDISHSSVERVIGPDSTILVDFMLARATKLIDGLVVYPENMKRNIEKTRGLIFSQRVLLQLVAKGLTREDAYEVVQRNAMKTWEEGADFRTLLLADPALKDKLTDADLDDAFDMSHHLKHVDALFERVFGPE